MVKNWLKKRLSIFPIACWLMMFINQFPKVEIDIIPNTKNRQTLTIFLEEINLNKLASSLGRSGKRILFLLKRKINRNRSKKPNKSTNNSKFWPLNIHWSPRSICGISLKIFRITISEIISNCLETQEVNERGK